MIIKFVFAMKDGTKIMIIYAFNVSKNSIGMRMIKNVMKMLFFTIVVHAQENNTAILTIAVVCYALKINTGIIHNV